MNLAGIFQISIYSLTALAGAMLAYGEEALFPSGLTVLMSGLALWFSERRRMLRLPTLLTNLLGLAALGLASVEFFGNREDARLLAAAHLLVYFTWIVLFQSKEMRHYWWLCALSLLQAALGPLLTLSWGWYGVLLLVYLLLAIWTLSVFNLYHGAVEFGALPASGEGLPPEGSAVPDGRPPSASQALTTIHRIFASDRRSTVHNAIEQESPGRWIVPRFIGVVVGLSFVGLTLGLGMFLIIPRMWIGSGLQSQNIPGRAGPTVTGFSDQVRLGQLGQILESTERVMVVEVFDNDTNQPLDLEQFAEEQGCPGPLFRGNVLDSYENGRWSIEGRGSHTQVIKPHPQDERMVRQSYSLELRNSDVLFTIPPFEMAELKPNDPVRVDFDTNVLGTAAEGRDPLVYCVYSTPRKAGSNAPGQQGRGGILRRLRTSQMALERCRRLPEERLERLIGLARELTTSAKLAGTDDLPLAQRMALTLETHLRDSGIYAYSLNMAVADPDIDPVEDFLFNRQRGHCEYFASALVLMLRAVDVPSRLVTGFKGADRLGSTGSYEVQQRHAHAWVEAYIDEKWMVLDPTPAARDDDVRERLAGAGFWRNARQSISSMWSNYVVSLSLTRQQQDLYDPLQGSVTTGWSAVRQAGQRVVAAVDGVKDALSSPESLLTPRAAALGLLSLAAAVVIFKLLRRLLKQDLSRAVYPTARRSWIGRLFDWLQERLKVRPRDPTGMVVAFYQQFQSVVRMAGLIPRLDQTQQEFARQVESNLAGRLAPAGLARFPTQLAELFYRVRFGEGALEPLERADIERRLDQLKEALLPLRPHSEPVGRLAEADLKD
jgi:hypothetical protein